jgi:hypothetical protein
LRCIFRDGLSDPHMRKAKLAYHQW